jgi:hypothetical protein
MKDITVIIPIHQFSDEVKKLLDRAISSVPKNVKIILSVPSNLQNNFTEYSENAEIICDEKQTKTDFCSLINQAVKKINTKWFSILEYDDVYTDIWFENVQKYADTLSDVSIFLPLVDLIDFNENKFIGFNNEAPWASSFSNEIGYIDRHYTQARRLSCLRLRYDTPELQHRAQQLQISAAQIIPIHFITLLLKNILFLFMPVVVLCRVCESRQILPFPNVGKCKS